jgi:hypothetical protein
MAAKTKVLFLPRTCGALEFGVEDGRIRFWRDCPFFMKIPQTTVNDL